MQFLALREVIRQRLNGMQFQIISDLLILVSSIENMGLLDDGLTKGADSHGVNARCTPILVCEFIMGILGCVHTWWWFALARPSAILGVIRFRGHAGLRRGGRGMSPPLRWWRWYVDKATRRVHAPQ